MTSDPGSTSDPNPESARTQLDAILRSELFATAGRHSRLLRYLVERTLAGEGDQLKEYVLGSEVFDRPDSYDPRLDSIVRVEVRRLRTRLEEYYRCAGADDPILIEIPRGTYVPVFRPRASTVEATTSQPEPHPPSRTRIGARAPLALITAALSIVLAALAANVAVHRDPAPALASNRPGIAVLPFADYSADPSNALLAARLTDAVTSALARTGHVSVASRTSAARYAAGRYTIPQVAQTLTVDFVVEASVTAAGEDVEVSARLVDGRLDRKVWVADYTIRRADVGDASRRMADDIAAAALRIRP